jgi:MoxR-like ATPase
MEGSKFREKVLLETKNFIVGQERLIDRILVGMLCGGHILLEGVPGLAKTRLLSVLSAIIGTEVYQPNSGTFKLRKGPIFTNILLADEINRAPAKVQSALLQAMQEKQVTIGEETFNLPAPFFVLATQNPIEQEGTYPLPEAQLDRFLFKIISEYPTREEEVSILLSVGATLEDQPLPSPVITLKELTAISKKTEDVYVDPKIDHFIVELVQATRHPAEYGLGDLVEWGASPRAGLALKRAARALAVLRGEEFVSPELIQELAPDVLRHRVLLSFEAEARQVKVDEVINSLLGRISKP